MFGVSYRWIKIYSSVILISLVSKLTGYLRDALITARFGATLITDAYVVALLIPEVLFNIFGNSLTANFAPVYYEAEKRNRHRQFVSSLFSLYLVLAGLVFWLGNQNTEVLITMFSSGFKAAAFNTTTFFLKIFLANIFFISITYICLAYLQAHNQFLIPSTIGIFYNLAIIASMGYRTEGSGINLLIIGTLTGYIAQFAVQIPQAVSRGLPMPTLKISLSPELRKYIYLSIPIAFLAILGQLNIAMDNFFASRLSEGSITTLNLGYRVLMGIYSLFITNTMMIVYPILSKSIVQREHFKTSEILQKTSNLMIILLTPLAVYLYSHSGLIIDLMFKRGAFTEKQSALTALVFQGYMVGLNFFAFRDLIMRYFFANNIAIIPMINGLVNSSLNFVYLLILVPMLGLPGVSLATALSAVSSCLILFFWAKLKFPVFKKFEFWGFGVKILGISLIAIVITNFTSPALFLFITGDSVVCNLFRLLSGFVIFAAAYIFLFLSLFKRKFFGFFYH